MRKTKTKPGERIALTNPFRLSIVSGSLCAHLMIHSGDERSLLLALSVAFNGKTKMPATYSRFVFGQKRDLDEQKMINN